MVILRVLWDSGKVGAGKVGVGGHRFPQRSRLRNLPAAVWLPLVTAAFNPEPGGQDSEVTEKGSIFPVMGPGCCRPETVKLEVVRDVQAERTWGVLAFKWSDME